MSTSPVALATSLVAALFLYGSPSTLTNDPDSQRDVARLVAVTVDSVRLAIGADRTLLESVTRHVRTLVSARSAEDFDEAQGAKICRALRRGWMVATIRRHPRADAFRSLTFALTVDRYTRAQHALALQLIAEVG
ncbi:MAG: hypothetical protein Q8S73_43125 [Deltaproteobacteria bacterium]|nr:hypothetical protein [Myxococcales bacterium]MDP3220956.1 hypothetical protein [Deltaproteobacteria bacterium]